MTYGKWLDLRHLMQLIVLYGLFALLGGLVTFGILLAVYVSPNQIFAFLAGGATGIVISIMWKMNVFRHATESISRLADFTGLMRHF